MFHQLPPVGNPVHLSSVDQPESLLQSFFAPYQAKYFASGTAALAAAIIAAKQLKNVEHPEVILPAYGCPDLVSAVIFTGAKPVLVDLEPERPWMDLQQLLLRVSSSTVAIVAVNLFGISERIALLRPIAEHVGAVIIEDSAQAFPGKEEKGIWRGDLVVLSFGRGKPVNLLGGGAVLCLQESLGDLLPQVNNGSMNGWSNHILYRLKAKLFNQMISPGLYWLPQSMPFLNIGETHYHPLHAIEAMDLTRLAMLPANITAYQDIGMETQDALREMFREMDTIAAGIIDLPGACQVPSARRLLRYPLLVDATMRDRLHRRLHRLGSGSSMMYPAVLPDIPGLDMLPGEPGAFPAAESFATCILTLPTHGQVGVEDIVNIRQTLLAG